MGKVFKQVQQIIHVALENYLSWLFDARMFIVVLVILFCDVYITEPLLVHAMKMGEKLNMWEPFIASCNSSFMTLLYPIVFLILISDFPFQKENMVFVISRIGKIKWLLSQVVFVVLAAITFLAMMVSGMLAMVAAKGEFSTSWSDVITKYGNYFPEEREDFASKLIDYNIINHLNVTESVGHSLGLLLGYFLVIAMILLFFSVCNQKYAGLLCVVIIISFGMVSCSFDVAWKWYFPMANAIGWLHFHELFQEEIVPLSQSYLYFGVLAGIGVIASMIRVRKMRLY